MSRFAVVWLVAARELGERLRGRTLWIGTGLGVVLVVASLLLPSVIGGPKTVHVGLVGPRAQSLSAALVRSGTAFNLDLSASSQADATAAEAQLGGRRATLDAVVEDSGADGFRVVTQNAISTPLLDVITGAATGAHLVGTLQTAGVSPAAIAAATTPPPLAFDSLVAAPQDLAGRAAAAILASFLLMYTLTGWGGIVAAGVAQEKRRAWPRCLSPRCRPGSCSPAR